MCGDETKSSVSENRTDLSYSKMREKALEEKGPGCFICDRNRGYSNSQDISIHHINGDDTDHRIENLLPVCQSCHIRIHRRDEEPYKNWHRKLPEEKQLTTGDLQERYDRREEIRSRRGNLVLRVSRGAAEEISLDTMDKIEVSSDSAAETLIEEWNNQCSSGTIHLRKAPPRTRDTEVTHIVSRSR